MTVNRAASYDELIEIVEVQPEESTEPLQYSEDETFPAEYQDLYLENNDLVGWIRIDDIKINYPVMQSKDEPDFYLRHRFDKKYSTYGCPYVQEDYDVDSLSDNLVIYGHHVKDGSMFAGLMKYTDKSFWKTTEKPITRELLRNVRTELAVP